MLRAFGNFSRFVSFRELLVSTGASEALVVLLEHSDVKVLFGASGILLNLAADSSGDAVFRKNNCEPLERLYSALDSFMLEAPALSSLLCKIFLNLTSLVREHPPLVVRLRGLAAELQDGIEWAETEEQARIPFMERVSADEKELHGICRKLLGVLREEVH